MNVSQNINDAAGFAPEEIITSEPTRSARLKWVIVADEAVTAGLMVNAVACIAASTGAAVTGLIGPGGRDASGHSHPGLPWAGCTVLTASSAALAEIREKAAGTNSLPGIMLRHCARWPSLQAAGAPRAAD
jgi:hypothetical protein